MESETYRGYEIAAQREGIVWRVWAHPQRPELPITRKVSFRVEARSPEEALAKVKQKIDGLLWPL
jgi:hypothetical protein